MWIDFYNNPTPFFLCHDDERKVVEFFLRLSGKRKKQKKKKVDEMGEMSTWSRRMTAVQVLKEGRERVKG
jgi:hypothetical protein